MYFIEVTKLSGLKTYFGKELVEMYKLKEQLKPTEGFDTEGVARAKAESVKEDCEVMNRLVTSINVIRL